MTPGCDGTAHNSHDDDDGDDEPIPFEFLLSLLLMITDVRCVRLTG